MRRPLVCALVTGALIVAVLGIVQPAGVLEGCDVVGYAVCHQIPERSFHLPGRPLPLCARCTGTFLGAMLGFGVIFARGRSRAGNVPPFPVLALFALFFVLWGADGLNSYLTLFEGLPHLYAPHNTLRLATGLLLGLTLSNLAYPVAGMTFWREPTPERSVENLGELGLLLLLAGLLALAVLSGFAPLLYVLSVFSTLGVLLLLLLVNTLIALVVMRRENQADRWRDLWAPALLGALLTGGLIAGMNLLRAYLAVAFGVSF